MERTDSPIPTKVMTVPWYKRAAVWLGIGINSASISLGGGLATVMPFAPLLPVMVVGAILLTGLAIAQGVSARRRRQPLGRRAAQTFGLGLGAGVLNLAMAVGMIGWGGFHNGVSGASAANLFGLPTWAGSLLIATAVFVLSELGVNRWNALMWITTLSALALAISALVIINAQPSWQTGQPFTLSQALWVIGTIITYAILFSLRCPDFTWDLESDADVYKSGLAFLLSLLVGMSVGAILYQTTGNWNLADILAAERSATLGYIFLIIAVASPLLSGMHSGVLAMQTLLPINKRFGTAFICLTTFILGATRFDRQFLPFLDVLSALLPPALFIMLVVAWWRPRTSARTALWAWLAGAVVALVFKLQGQLLHMPLGALASIGVLYLDAYINRLLPMEFWFKNKK